MVLILEQHPTDFGLLLRDAAERKGIGAVSLTSAEIALDSALVYRLDNSRASFSLRCPVGRVESAELEGVYCSINTFEPGLWDSFTSTDAEYAAQEAHALWLAILSSLPCRVVNPPAPDTLAGTFLTTPEIMCLAHQVGFRVPMVAEVESGKVAAELLSPEVRTLHADLGEQWIGEGALGNADIPALTRNRNHFRVREVLAGRPVHVAVLGRRFFACRPDASGVPAPVSLRDIPRPVVRRLRAIQKRLSLALAEYSLTAGPDDNWAFAGYNRTPVHTAVAYGRGLHEAIVEFLVKERL